MVRVRYPGSQPWSSGTHPSTIANSAALQYAPRPSGRNWSSRLGGTVERCAAIRADDCLRPTLGEHEPPTPRMRRVRWPAIEAENFERPERGIEGRGGSARGPFVRRESSHERSGGPHGRRIRCPRSPDRECRISTPAKAFPVLFVAHAASWRRAARTPVRGAKESG